MRWRGLDHDHIGVAIAIEIGDGDAAGWTAVATDAGEVRDGAKSQAAVVVQELVGPRPR